MRSVTLARLRHLMLVLAAAAVLVVMRGFSAAPAMADPVIIEPAELTITEPVFDNDLGFVSFDNDLVMTRELRCSSKCLIARNRR